ncbi:hypothetical protein [uncultured Thiothrix sp.]|uniref:portal protein n=1 Tax=uncultured Thiothrix sp. TaxID=223185 RepID=UPI00263216B6|nr:hypothetical protein [uncultured Thiothrix sp.]
MTELANYLKSILVDDMIAHKNSTVTDRLEWCKIVSKRGLTGCTQPEQFEKELGKAGLTVIPRKVDDLYSWLIDMMINAFDDLFRIEPTARPDLSEATKEKAAKAILATVKTIAEQRANAAIQQVMGEYAQIGVKVTPEQALSLADNRGAKLRPDEKELREVVLSMKGVAREYETQEAIKGAKELSLLIKDFLQETKSLNELKDFLHDYCIYPFAVLEGNFLRSINKRVWKKNKLVRERKLIPSLARISPYDFFWTRDSTDTQDGMGIAVRKAMRRFDIQELSRRDDFDKEAIKDLLADKEVSAREWLVVQEKTEDISFWSRRPNETIDVFRMFIVISGEYLKDYKKKFKNLDTEKQYQLEVYLADKYILGMWLHDADYVRPFWKEVYEPVPSEFCGNSLPENLAVVNAAARRGFIHLLRNMGKSTNPSVFVNREMIDYDSLEEQEVILPDNQYDFIASIGSTGKPVDMLNFPNYTNQILTFMEYLDTRADIESGIPKYALGQASGLPSALRSTASLTLMIDSAMKTIKSRVYRVGIGVIAPAIQDIVDWVMDNWNEDFVKVDAEVYVRGLEGIVTKSLVIGKIQELLQYLAPFVQSGTVDPAVISSLVNRFMLEAGMDDMDFHKSQLEIGSAMGQLQSTPVTASQGQQANG